MSHFIEKCKHCGTVISQCRCPDPNKEVKWAICKACKQSPPTPFCTYENTAKQKVQPINFIEELQSLINEHSLEQYSGTPDFILAQYLYDCLRAFNNALQTRERYCGRPINVVKETK